MTTTTTTRCTKLSASGLVYRHYGRDVIRAHYPQLTYGSTELDWVYVRMYDEFMEAIDAIDTGVEPVPPPPTGSGSIGIVGPLYRDVTGLSSRVSRLNPRWNEVEETARDAHAGAAGVDDLDDIDDIDGTVVVRAAPPDPNARFEIACRMCGDDFLDVLTKVVEGDLPARSIVEDAVRGRTDVDASGEIMRLSSWGLPWKSELYELEYELGITVPIKYVLYEDQAGMWRVQCVSVRGKSFENRLGLPEEWRGVRDEDLSKMAGIDGCTFCHASGFIGGNVSYEGALEMARASLRAAGKVKVEF
ncbi:hypothetical protein ACHAXA_001448 [Cyclostephanos tholiformis]|uniref:Uncharacterized protein n=1 Tax=Cyclostephanos tholiformis TaxID=382380 RepID=A0ABD3RZ28_9STRA